MLKFGLLTIISVVTLQPAFAADIAKNIGASHASYNWSGAYIGGHAGVLQGHSKNYSDCDMPCSLTSNTAAGGIYAGYNYQFPNNNFVLGVEIDASKMSFNKQRDTLAFYPFFDAVKASSQWQASVRGRVGYAFGNVLPFVTAGLAYAQSRQSYIEHYANIGVTDVSQERKILAGASFGAGVEYAFTPNIIGRAEYQHMGFKRALYQNAFIAADLKTDVVRAGLAYKF